jgi:L-ascorbate metabolism protein UlaG (beta-lactamase superfamily)
VDILCATHQHRDHFYPPFVATHLKNNPAGTFISGQQAFDLLMEEAKTSVSENQVLSITPSKLSVLHFKFDT